MFEILISYACSDPEALEKMVNNYHGPGETVFPVFMQFSPSGEMDSRTFMKVCALPTKV